MNNQIPSYYLAIMMVFVGLAITPFVQASDTTMTDSGDTKYEIGGGFIKGDAQDDLFSMINFLTSIGLDISYGNEGETIFSMIDYSLSKIITDLSAGNVEGIKSNPLILETLQYVNISESEIILDPDNISGNLEAMNGYYEYEMKNL